MLKPTDNTGALVGPAPAIAAVEPVPAVAAPPPVSTARVERTLALYLKNIVNAASSQTDQLRQRAAAQEREYETPPGGKTAKQRSEDIDNWIKVNESSDQTDDQTNILMNLFTEDGAAVRIEPKASETKERADVLEMAVHYELRTTDFESTLERATKNYVTMPFSGLKSVRDYEDGQSRFYIKQVDPNCVAVSDIGRKDQDQFAFCELHFFTKREMRQRGFKNLDKLKSPDANGQQSISPLQIDGQDQSPNVTGSEKYRVWETWNSPIFTEWVENKKLSSEEAAQWISDWGLPAEYLWQPDPVTGYNGAEGNLLRFFHDENGVILKVAINYLTRPKRFPYHCGSWYAPLSAKFAGMAQTERSADLFSAQEVMINDCYRNAKLIGNQSMFVSMRAQVSPDQMQKIYKPRGMVLFAGNDAVANLFQGFNPPAISKDLFPMIELFQTKIEQGGVTDTMRGEGNSKTATEARSNNMRGQMQTNASGARFVRECLLPACDDVMQMIVAFYGDKWLQVCGDKGAEMMKWMFTSATEIDQHFKCVPVTSFDYFLQGNMVAEIANLIQVGGPMLPPDVMARCFKVALDHTRIPLSQREFIMGTLGQISKIMDELDTLRLDPNAIITVLPDDNHEAALLGVQMIVMGNPQTGEPPMPMFAQFPGVRRYVEQHMILLEQQRQLMMQQQLMEKGKAGAPKGNTKQVTDGQIPTGEDSKTRSEAQMGSPMDDTAMPGNTGMGAMQ